MTRRKELLSLHKERIFQNGQGRWETYIDGKRVRYRDRKHMEDALVEHYSSINSGHTLQEVFDEWIEVKKTRDGICSNSVYQYKRAFNLLCDDTKKKHIEKMSPADIEDFMISCIKRNELTKTDFYNVKLIVYGIFKMARKKGYTDIHIHETISDMEIPKNIFRVVRKSNEKLVFTEEEMERVIDYIIRNSKKEADLGLVLCFKTGIRPGELSTIKPEDIGDGYIHICRTERAELDEMGKKYFIVKETPKTDAGVRDVYVPESCSWLLDELRNISRGREYVFERNGERVKNYYFNARLRAICGRLGIPTKSVNKIRKTYATILIDGNVSESVIKAQMGHTDIRTTKKYYYKMRKDKEARQKMINEVAELC